MGSRVSGERVDHHIWTTEHLARVELALSNWVVLPSRAMASAGLTQLCEAMRYAVLDGGKRLRPLLVFAAAEAAGGWRTESGSQTLGIEPSDAALRAACAVELIHAYSLVHDDMPCMDNDVLRRGKPTVHVKFGEAQALLAGDALQALAFELLTPEASSSERIDPAVQATLCRLLATSAGCQGMAGGQAIDLASVGELLTLDELQNMHKLKTGALLQTSVMMGAACGHMLPHAQAALAEYGAVLGLAFQVIDDILDVTADTATLGKTAGKDAQDNKPTFVSLLGLKASQAYAQTLHGQAMQALQKSGLADTRALAALADVVVNRKM